MRRDLIWVVGVTCASHEDGPAGPLDATTRAAIGEAALVAGGRRHLDLLAPALAAEARQVELAGDLRAALDELVAFDGPAAVLASGDPGFFGILRALRQRVDPERLVVLPSVSSVAAAFAAEGLPWDDAVVVSAHGRDRDFAVNICRRFPKVAVLTDPGFGPGDLAGALVKGSPTAPARRYVVGERLGTPAARIVGGPAELVRAQRWSDPNVVLVLEDGVASSTSSKGQAFGRRHSPPRWGLPESVFDHRDGLVTKAEVRAVALAWLGPGLGDLVWDVGAASGSVAIEAARFGAAAIAVEEDADECARLEANAALHEVPVDVVQGRAPGVLAELPDPDAVFVGGGGVDTDAIVAVAAIRARRVVVVALATIERVAPVQAGLAAAGLEVSATLVQAARLAPLAGGQRLAATNPVFLVEGRRP